MSLIPSWVRATVRSNFFFPSLSLPSCSQYVIAQVRVCRGNWLFGCSAVQV